MLQNFIMGVLVYLYYPETANLSLEAIDVIFLEDYTGWRSAVRKSIVMHKDAKRNAGARANLEGIHLSEHVQQSEGTNDKGEVSTYEQI